MVAALLSPWIRYLLGPGLIALGAFGPSPLSIALVLVGWLLVAGSSWAADVQLRQQDAVQGILMLLDHAVSCFEAASPSPATRSLRAALFVLDVDANALKVCYSSSGYSKAEKDLMWTSGQGCVGMALERGQTVLAPEDVELPVTPSDADKASRPWNMTADQVRMTAGRVSCVVAVPISSAKDPTARAVFAVDDSKPFVDSPLGNSDVPPAIEQLADSLKELLDKGGWDQAR